MAPVALAAEKVQANRHPVETSNPLLAFEKIASSWIVTNLEIFAKTREALMEAMFLTVYGSPLLQAAVGLMAEHADAEHVSGDFHVMTPAELEADMGRGGFLDAGVRALLYVLRGEAPMSASSTLSKPYASALRKVSVCL
jgi:hypothetical protein